MSAPSAREDFASQEGPETWFANVKQGSAHRLAEAIANGADVNAQDHNGMTALHYAAAHGARPCIRVLVATGKCDYLLRDKWGRYATDLAIEWARDYAVAELLAKHQARQAFQRGVPVVVLDP